MAIHVFKDWLEKQGGNKPYNNFTRDRNSLKVPLKIARHFPCSCHANGWQGGDFFIHYDFITADAWIHACGDGYKLPTVHRIILRVEHYHKGRGYKKEGYWWREFLASNHAHPPAWVLDDSAYAYQFEDQTLSTDENVRLKCEYSRRHIIDGKVYTLTEIKERYPRNKMLIDWVERWTTQRVIWCRTRNWTLFDPKEDIIETSNWYEKIMSDKNKKQKQSFDRWLQVQLEQNPGVITLTVPSDISENFPCSCPKKKDVWVGGGWNRWEGESMRISYPIIFTIELREGVWAHATCGTSITGLQAPAPTSRPKIDRRKSKYDYPLQYGCMGHTKK